MTRARSIDDQNKFILYVDDEPKALKYFTQLFSDQFSILTAESADEAIRLIENDPDRISVLITDQRMPGRTGVELMEQVKNEFPSIVRVLTTAHTNLESAIRAVNDGGAFRYLTKPWNEQEIVGTLLRAQEFNAAISERDRLLQEKLSVLHRLIVMDRVRGLATMTTALGRQLRNAWPALVAYMSQSPVDRRIRIQMDEISQLNMVALARREAECMVSTVQQILSDTVVPSTGDSEIDVHQLIVKFESVHRQSLLDDDIKLTTKFGLESILIQSDAGMLTHLIEMMVRRICDAQDAPTQIVLSIDSRRDGITLSVKGDFRDLGEQEHAAFFSAAIPLKKWPIGLDMDLLACFFVAHHLGGGLEIRSAAPEGPAIIATLPSVLPLYTSPTINPQWFETVYASLEHWQDEIHTAG